MSMTQTPQPPGLEKDPVPGQQCVYVVDDDEAMRDSMVWLIESEGLPVHPFASAEAFLAYYQDGLAGCLVLDVRMPGMSGLEFIIQEVLEEWHDYQRRGRMARNMQPAHLAVAQERGSLGVGRFYFRVKVDTGQVFDLYYDREIKDVDDRLGHWFLYRELSTGPGSGKP